MSEQTFQLVTSIRRRLQATVRRITLAELTFGLVLTLGVLSAVWLFSVAFEAGFWMGTMPRTVLFAALLLVAAGLFAYFLLLPALRLAGLLRGPSEEAVATQIGTRYPEVSDRLLNLLQLAEGRRSEAPEPLVDGAVRMLGEEIRTVEFERLEDFGRARRAGRLATFPLVGLLVFLIAAPGTFLGASKRLLSPGTHFQRPAPFQLVVEPGSVDLVKGEPLEISVLATGEALPQTVTLSLNNLDERLVETVTLRPDSAGVFRHTAVNVRTSLRYRVSAAPVLSAWYEATVQERPLVRGLQVTVTSPAYTRIPPQRLDPNVGDVTALPGTRVDVLVGLGGQSIEKAALRFDDGSEVPLEVDGLDAEGSFRLVRPGEYEVRLSNAQGLENDAPIAYSLTLLSDAYPSIVLLEPSPESTLNDALRAGLRMRINDDFGFTRLALHYRLAESRFGTPSETFEALPLPLDAPQQLDQEVLYDWLLAQSTGLDPVPGDVIEYYVQVWDNDAVAGRKSARSPVYRLRLPSLAEQYRQLESGQDEAETEMEDMMRDAESIREQFEQLRDELRRKPEADWEDKRQLEQLQQRQEEMEQRVNDLAQQMEQMTRQMQDNNLVSEETLEMYQELQEVVQEINSPEMREALKQLQQSLENLDLQQMQQSLGDFEFNEQQYQQRLERTLELFKRIRVQQKLEEAARRAEALAREQERLAEESNRQEQGGERQQGEQQEGEQQQGEQQEGERQEGEQQQGEQQEGEQQEGEQKDGQPRSPEEMARSQERSSQEMKELEQALSELREQMQEMQNTPSEEMQQLEQDTRQQQMPEQMQQNAEQLRQQQFQEARQQQQQMQQQLQQMQQQLQQMQQQMQGQQMQINMAGLRRALSEILTLSQQQETLRSSVEGQSADSPALRDQAQDQVELGEALSVVSDSLQRLAREIPQMTREVQQHAGEALREMGSATEAMADRRANQATGFQKGSMMHLNELALLLSDLLEQLMNSQSGGGGGMSMQQMMQQLQQMAGQQQQLNEQIQQFLNDMQGNRLSSDAQQRLQQMARQQEALRRQLEQLNRNPELRNKALGDLERVAEQMEETIRELQRRQVDRQTVQRQQQILQRLLDAQRSLREQGQEKRRESQQGRDFDRTSPAELTPSEQAEKLRRDLIRALESGYAPDYEELIKRYFELLQEQSGTEERE